MLLWQNESLFKKVSKIQSAYSDSETEMKPIKILIVEPRLSEAVGDSSCYSTHSSRLFSGHKATLLKSEPSESLLTFIAKTGTGGFMTIDFLI